MKCRYVDNMNVCFSIRLSPLKYKLWTQWSWFWCASHEYKPRTCRAGFAEPWVSSDRSSALPSSSLWRFAHSTCISLFSVFVFFLFLFNPPYLLHLCCAFVQSRFTFLCVRTMKLFNGSCWKSFSCFLRFLKVFFFQINFVLFRFFT